MNQYCGGVDGAHGNKGHPIDSIFIYNSVPRTYSQLPAVRLVNGQQLPSPWGLTIATPMPIYVVGNYNIQTNSSGSQSVLTTNTAWTWPAALMGDAITILSSKWNDAGSAYVSGGALSSRTTVNTTVNAACLDGIVPSVTVGGAKHYSGGFENFLRLLESWNTTLYHNGSIAVMFPSIIATNYWQPTGNYYNVPTRQWSFDANFLNPMQLPPLTPLLGGKLWIFTQPQNQTNFSGSTVVFNVVAMGSSPLGYQWRFNGTDLDGATNNSLTLTNVQVSQAGSYAVLVTNTFGSILSSNAVLTVTATPPIIQAQPTNQTVFVNGTATFGVTATGSLPLSCQWRFNGTEIDGATNAVLTLTNVQANQAGIYAAQVTNAFGSTNSISAVLTVVAVPPTIQTQPANQTVIAGGSMIFSVTAAGSLPLSYQWQFNGADITDATNRSLTIDNVQTNSGGPYQVIVTNAYGSVTSSIAMLTVTRSLVVAWGENIFGQADVPVGLANVVAIAAGGYHSLALENDGSPVILRQPTSQTVLNSATIVFNASVVGRSQLSYQWQKDGANLTDGGNVSGATTVALTLTNVQTNDVGIYALVVTNDFGSTVSSNALLTVLVPPSITTQPAGCTNVAGTTASFNVVADGTAPLSCQWHATGRISLMPPTPR